MDDEAVVVHLREYLVHAGNLSTISQFSSLRHLRIAKAMRRSRSGVTSARPSRLSSMP